MSLFWLTGALRHLFPRIPSDWACTGCIKLQESWKEDIVVCQAGEASSLYIYAPITSISRHNCDMLGGILTTSSWWTTEKPKKPINHCTQLERKQTDRRTDGHYQMHYPLAVLSYTVDKKLCNWVDMQFLWWWWLPYRTTSWIATILIMHMSTGGRKCRNKDSIVCISGGP